MNYTTSDTNGTKELEIAKWLLENKEEILSQVPKANKHYSLLPDALYDIYVQEYSDRVLKTIKEQVLVELDPEELNSIVTKEWVSMVVGQKVFSPCE